MAPSHLARNAPTRKPLAGVAKVPAARRGAGSRSVSKRYSRPSPTAHLTADEYARLLAYIEDKGGIVTIDEISRAMPRVIRPISAVFDLCDMGILNVDWEAAFDGDMRVWRVNP